MKSIHCFQLLLAPLLISQVSANIEPILAELADSLYFETPDGSGAVALGLSSDLTTYGWTGQQPIGIVGYDGAENAIYEPRLTLAGDAWLGQRLYGFAKIRYDRGYDPGVPMDRVRIDELFARLTIIQEHLDLQVGKFGTIFGNYTGRHEPWDNPFVTPPLPYDQVTSVTDNAPPPSATAFANRRDVNDVLKTWAPVLWGPVYTQGAAFFATWEQFDLAASIKNRALMSRPYEWNDHDYSAPSWTTRLGFRHSPEWEFGISGSIGPYLRPSAHNHPNLPAGKSSDDYDQITVGTDLAWKDGRWEVHAELIFSRFEVPNVGDADTFSYTVDAKRDLTANWFTAIRLGQQFYNEISLPGGQSARWDNTTTRLDLALGYRLNRHLQVKAQLSTQHDDGTPEHGPVQGNLQFTARL